MFILRVILVTSILFISSCSNTIEDIKQIGKKPHLTKIDPPVVWAPDNQNSYIRNANSLWQPGSRDFFRDNRARRVGDILKVEININDKATLSNTTITKRESKEDLGLGGLFGLQTKLDKVIPMQAGAPLVGTTSGNNLSGKGDVDRTENIKTQIAAMVKQILPNGNLLVEGHQEVRVNYEVRELNIAGIVRPEDISADNTVSADQIAEARISYGGRGAISRVQQPRYGSQLLDIILPW